MPVARLIFFLGGGGLELQKVDLLDRLSNIALEAFKNKISNINLLDTTKAKGALINCSFAAVPCLCPVHDVHASLVELADTQYSTDVDHPKWVGPHYKSG